MRADFEAAGARLTIVAGTDTGAPEFMEDVWKGGELFVDDQDKVKQALGGRQYKNYWLLRPSVVRHLVSYVSRFGSGQSDLLHDKTKLLGGTLVFSEQGEIVYEFLETTSFYQGSAADLLEAVKGLSCSVAPLQTEVCD
mmetsp:Transcript_86/g.191  ORF Transcript_86/g.191 Transcript_86/m.191 type:complete len:139 (+) Transcript_86:265-681(+)